MCISIGLYVYKQNCFKDSLTVPKRVPILLLEFSFPFVRSFVPIFYMHRTCIVVMMAWVTLPVRPKGAKDEVQQTRRAPS